MKSRIFLLTLFLAACNGIWTSEDVCDCRFLDRTEPSNWEPLAAPPTNFDHEHIRSLFEESPQDKSSVTLFDKSDVFWYQNDIGESAACLVFESRKDISAYFLLPPDPDVSDPTDFRILGTPFGNDECRKIGY